MERLLLEHARGNVRVHRAALLLRRVTAERAHHLRPRGVGGDRRPVGGEFGGVLAGVLGGRDAEGMRRGCGGDAEGRKDGGDNGCVNRGCL